MMKRKKQRGFTAWLKSDAIESDYATAHMLMQIARHPFLSNVSNYEHLPRAFNTLGILCRLIAVTIKEHIATGKINRDMTMEDAYALVPKRTGRALATLEPEDDTQEDEEQQESDQDEADEPGQPEEPSSLEKLTVVLWSGTGHEPLKFYNYRSWPNVIYVHLWPEDMYELRRGGWCQCDQRLIVEVKVKEHEAIHRGHRVLVCSRRCSIDSYDGFPKEVVPIPTIIDSIDDLIRILERAWPTARKIAVGFKEAPNGWELYVKRSRNKAEIAA